MAGNGEQAEERQARRRGLRATWTQIVWPGLVITCIGVAAVVFLISCARVSVMELEVRDLSRQIDKQTAVRCQLWQRIAQLRDRGRLRAFAEQAGMVFEPGASDLVQLPVLSQPQRPVTAMTPQPGTWTGRAPQPQPPTGSGTVVAGAF